MRLFRFFSNCQKPFVYCVENKMSQLQAHSFLSQMNFDLFVVRQACCDFFTVLSPKLLCSVWKHQTDLKRMTAMSLWFNCWSYQHVNSCHCLHGTFIIFPFCWVKMWDSMCFCFRTNNPKQTHIHVMHMHAICWSNKKRSLSEWMKMSWTKKKSVSVLVLFFSVLFGRWFCPCHCKLNRF